MFFCKAFRLFARRLCFYKVQMCWMLGQEGRCLYLWPRRWPMGASFHATNQSSVLFWRYMQRQTQQSTCQILPLSADQTLLFYRMSNSSGKDKTNFLTFRVKRRTPWNIDAKPSGLATTRRMGLEGSEFMEKIEVFDSSRWNFGQGLNSASLCSPDSCLIGDMLMNDDPNYQMQLLLQVRIFF